MRAGAGVGGDREGAAGVGRGGVAALPVRGRFIAGGMTQTAEMPTTDYRQVVVVPSVGVQVMEPC